MYMDIILAFEYTVLGHFNMYKCTLYMSIITKYLLTIDNSKQPKVIL